MTEKPRAAPRTPPAPPSAPRRPHRHLAHGVAREDPWAWLRDPDWRAVMRDPAVLDPEIRACLEAENAYAEAMLDDVAGLRRGLFAELKARIKPDDASAPAPDGPWAYYFRYQAAGQHPLYCRRPRDGGAETALLDGDALARPHAFYRLGGVRQSFDHRRLLWSEDVSGAELYRIQVKDIESGETLGPPVETAAAEAVWTADGESFLYTKQNDDLRPDRVFLHRVGDDPAQDRLIWREPDSGFFLSVGESSSRRLILLESRASDRSETRFLHADQAEAAPVLIAARRPGHEYEVTDQGARLIIRSNRDGAVDFKLMQAPISTPEEANWRELTPAREGVLLRRVIAFRDRLVRLETVNALPRIIVTDSTTGSATGAEHEIGFDEEAYALGLSAAQEYDSERLRFVYSSPTTPEQVYDYDMASRRRLLVKQQEIPSGHDPEHYCVRRIAATAADGTTIPVTVLHAKTARLDGSEPVLLYGYGAYGLSTPAAFSPHRFSLIDRGFIHVIAHIRGGMEKGYGWYLDGKLDRKPNSFSDFIVAAEALIARGWARGGHIAIHGGSAGGMLVGAVANMRPDLWRAVVAEVPFVDCLTTILDDSLPLTPPEWTEWGNPGADKSVHDLMLSYSPYDNVTAQDYPAMLITGGLTDPRVTYWEPAKWAAKLRATRTDANLLLLHINMAAGHAGDGGRFDKLKDVALNYAFLLKVFGLAGTPPSKEPTGSAASARGRRG